jgi:hypothetical protein
MLSWAIKQAHRPAKELNMPWSTQSSDDSSKVQVSTDSSRDRPQTDFLIIDRDSGEKEHIAIGEDGSVTYPGHNPDNVTISDPK